MRKHRIRTCASGLSLCALLLASPVRAADPAPKTFSQRAWTVAAYLPNRFFDLCDIARLRVRIGTGFAAGARVTRYLPVFIGDYQAIWFGLPGPRGRARLPLPAGSEGESGAGVGTARIGSASNAPTYGVGEVGAGAMLYLVGLDVGIDLYEVVDFLTGLATVDISGDDF